MAQPARADHQQPDHQQHQAGRAVVAADLAAQRAANSSAQIEDLKIAAQQFQSAVGSELLVAKLDGKSRLITRHNRVTVNRILGAFRVVWSCLSAHSQKTRQRPLSFDQSSTTGRIFFVLRLTLKIDTLSGLLTDGGHMRRHL